MSALCAPGLTELQECFGDAPSPWLRLGELLSCLRETLPGFPPAAAPGPPLPGASAGGVTLATAPCRGAPVHA